MCTVQPKTLAAGCEHKHEQMLTALVLGLLSAQQNKKEEPKDPNIFIYMFSFCIFDQSQFEKLPASHLIHFNPDILKAQLA